MCNQSAVLEFVSVKIELEVNPDPPDISFEACSLKGDKNNRSGPHQRARSSFLVQARVNVVEQRTAVSDRVVSGEVCVGLLTRSPIEGHIERY